MDRARQVAFIRLEFPPAQRDIAQALAAAFAEVVGERILHLEPDRTVGDILNVPGADRLDTAELLLALGFDRRFAIDREFALSCHHRTFRDLVEQVAAQTASI